MRNVFLLSILFISIFHCDAQKYNALIADTTIYNLIIDITKNTQINESQLFAKHKIISQSIIEWDSSNFLASEIKRKFLFDSSDCLNEYVSMEDREFMFQQFLTVKRELWEEKFDTIPFFSKSPKKPYSFYKFSVPLLSVDKQYAIVRILLRAGGANGGYYLYHKEPNHHWKRICGVHLWVD